FALLAQDPKPEPIAHEIPFPDRGIADDFGPLFANPVPVCEIAKDPARWNGRRVIVSATVRIEFERFEISTERCRSRKLDSVWLEYAQGPVSQPTTWCCGDLTPRGPLTLRQDAEFRKFHRLLTEKRRAKDCPGDYCFSNEVRARLLGQIETV